MKKTILLALCCSAFTAFAQNGFFLQPEIGGGISNTCWQPFSTAPYPGQRSVFSYQGQLDIGYKAGKWQFITGLGYLRTGVKLQPGSIAAFKNDVFMPFDQTWFVLPYGITDYNPHIILPVKIGYELCRFNKNLSFIPFIGAELAYNMPRTFIYSYQSQKQVESMQSFNDNCNQYGIMGLVQLNLEYRLNNRYDITAGPSLHYMFTSELNFKDQHDYAVLINLGLKYNFKPRDQIIY